MTATVHQLSTKPAAEEEAFFTGARHARPLLDAIATDELPARALIVGSAGSGKSTELRRLHSLLVERGRPVIRLGLADDAGTMAPSDVLIVDDLQLLPAGRIHEVCRRAADPDAAIIVAMRPWPRAGAALTAARALEHVMPTVVAGHVVESEVAAYLRAAGRADGSGCLAQLLELTGGITWLISEALALHAADGCDDPTHAHLGHALIERIAQRLESVDQELRDTVEAVVIGGPGAVAAAHPDDRSDADDLVVHGHSEGFLLRNGDAPPVVREAVRAAIPVHRLLELTKRHGVHRATTGGDDPLLAGRDEWRVASMLCAHGDLLLRSDPARAAELYRRASETGMDPGGLVTRRVDASWAAGDLEQAAGLLDEVTAVNRTPNEDGFADAAAAIWSARTMMATASDAYAAHPPQTEASAARATVAHLGAGSPDRLTPFADLPTVTAAPTTLTVALRLFDRGLRGTMSADAGLETVGDLVRAAELYTSARTMLPTPELPAVVAAVAAIGAGQLSIARDVIDSALAGNHGGEWARRRLLLWSAWIATQGERPEDARQALHAAHGCRVAATPRDRLLETAVEIMLTRRFEDAASLEAAWLQRRDRVRFAGFDLYLLQPLCVLVMSAARVGDPDTMVPHLTDALALLERLGSPPLWSAHVHWAGIQQGILLNRPQLLAPHAHALVEASGHSPIAAAMSSAGRVWTAVLGGHVDADEVEESALALAGFGLQWDGARMAGHGSAKTADRKVATRLLACARRLHPTDAARQPLPAPAGSGPVASGLGTARVALSDRELDVAHLVLQGKTYAEIGKAIFISPRTAEHHIARIRQRLGATSRSDLIAKLRPLVGASSPAGVPPTQQGDAARPQTPIPPYLDPGVPPIPSAVTPRNVAGGRTEQWHQ